MGVMGCNTWKNTGSCLDPMAHFYTNSSTTNPRNLCNSRWPTTMCGGNAQVWCKKETNVVLSHMSMFSILVELLASVEINFGNPDQERTAHAQLHTLK